MFSPSQGIPCPPVPLNSNASFDNPTVWYRISGPGAQIRNDEFIEGYRVVCGFCSKGSIWAEAGKLGFRVICHADTTGILVLYSELSPSDAIVCYLCYTKGPHNFKCEYQRRPIFHVFPSLGCDSDHQFFRILDRDSWHNGNLYEDRQVTLSNKKMQENLESINATNSGIEERTIVTVRSSQQYHRPIVGDNSSYIICSSPLLHNAFLRKHEGPYRCEFPMCLKSFKKAGRYLEHHGSHGYNMQRYGCTLCIEDDMVPRDQCFRADRAEELRNHLERIHKIILLKTPGRQRHKYEDIQKHVATKMQDSEAFRIDMIKEYSKFENSGASLSSHIFQGLNKRQFLSAAIQCKIWGSATICPRPTEDNYPTPQSEDYPTPQSEVEPLTSCLEYIESDSSYVYPIDPLLE